MLETFSGDGGLGFTLVPWQPVLEKRIGQHITGVMLDNEFRTKAWVGLVSAIVGFIRLRRLRRTGVSRSRLALSRHRFAAHGLDPLQPAPQRPGKRLGPNGNATLPSTDILCLWRRRSTPYAALPCAH
jgi:hypothetical protein